MAENIDYYRKYFFGSMIEFKENDYMDIYSEDLFADINHPEKQLALVQKFYYMGRYLAISSFGECPPHSQGLWNGTVDGRLFCDYVSNLELEMALWVGFSGNFKEYVLRFFDFIEKFIPDFETNAKNLFGLNGIMVTSRFTNSGLLFHFDSKYTHQFWVAGAAWLAHIYYEYYLYTHDKNFLENRALPFMKKAADFYIGYIEDGCIAPSVSPENSPYENVFCMLGKNAVMDISAVKELFENLKQSCKLLGLEYEYDINIPPYMYENDGTIREWADERAVRAYPHRHLSQCYALMPGFEARKNPKLYEGIKMSVEKRIENGFYKEESDTCGWSVMHLMHIYARMNNVEGYMEALRFLLANYVRENFATFLIGHAKHYQIDANLGFVSAVYEMLLFSDEKSITLFPALSELFSAGEAKNLLVKGNRIVERLTWDEKKTTIRIKSFEESQFTIHFFREVQCVSMAEGDTIELEWAFQKRADNMK